MKSVDRTYSRQTCNQSHIPFHIRCMGMNDIYSSIVGSQAYLEAYYGLDGSSVAARAQAVLEGQQ